MEGIRKVFFFFLGGVFAITMLAKRETYISQRHVVCKQQKKKENSTEQILSLFSVLSDSSVKGGGWKKWRQAGYNPLTGSRQRMQTSEDTGNRQLGQQRERTRLQSSRAASCRKKGRGSRVRAVLSLYILGFLGSPIIKSSHQHKDKRS